MSLKARITGLALAAAFAASGAALANVSGTPDLIYQTVFSFPDHFHGATLPDGAAPFGSLVLGSDGAFYGTAAFGGANNRGTLFKLLGRHGPLVVLHDFGGFLGSGDAAVPDGTGPIEAQGLVEDSAHNWFGTTSQGGSFSQGVIFEMTADGFYQVLHHFSGTNFCEHSSAEAKSLSAKSIVLDGGACDGREPTAGPTIDAQGNLFGTTTLGGDFDEGIAWELPRNPDGSYGELIVLHAFRLGFDGQQPTFSSLIFDPAGNLYGTTASGGRLPINEGEPAFGTIFRLMPPVPPSTEWGYDVLHNFAGPPTEGAQPAGTLQWSLDGQTLFGTTVAGGTNDAGTVFRLDPPIPPASTWVLSTLHSFDGEDGLEVIGGVASVGGSQLLVGNSLGKFMGLKALSTPAKATFGGGTVFLVNADSGHFTVVHTFGSTPGDGLFGDATPVQIAPGDFLGTTLLGGTSDCRDSVNPEAATIGGKQTSTTTGGTSGGTTGETTGGTSGGTTGGTSGGTTGETTGGTTGGTSGGTSGGTTGGTIGCGTIYELNLFADPSGGGGIGGGGSGGDSDENSTSGAIDPSLLGAWLGLLMLGRIRQRKRSRQ